MRYRAPSPARAARAALAALALAATLVGCPLPQPLPDYPPGTITPPRIVVDDSVTQISSPETIVRVPASCPPGREPVYALDAQLRDANTIEAIDVRWFVNYDPTNPVAYTWQQQETVNATSPADPTLRDIRAFDFHPYPYDGVKQQPSDPQVAGDAPGALHVVELVVSNGFDPAGTRARLPNRSPAPGFEIQVYRWVFLNVAESQGCAAGEAGCILCPAAPAAVPSTPAP